MKAVEIKKGIYWVGAIDWNLRSFHGYTTQRGTTYNAYLIVDEKIALIDTVKAPFVPEMLQRIKSIINPERIDYIISNHVEMDHSGGIPAVMDIAKNAIVYTSFPQGEKGLTAHYGNLPYKAVKQGEDLSLGKRSLRFVPTPMVHWPDNMVSFCEQEGILFSNDAFGQHLASSGRFDDEEEKEIIFEEARRYYANIVMPYGAQTAKAIEAVQGLTIKIIAPSHEVIWRQRINNILSLYKSWTSDEKENKGIVIYDSMWHSTETMAKTICEAFANAGVKAKLFDLKENHNSDTMTELLTAKYVAVGSPTLNNNMLPTVAGALTYMKGLLPKGRKGFAFGSYGWGGQSIGQVNTALQEAGVEIMLEPVKLQYIPNEEQLKSLYKKVITSL